MKFTVVVGKYNYSHSIKSKQEFFDGLHLFTENIIHEDTFEINWSLPPYCSEIPYKMLEAAKDRAMEITFDLPTGKGLREYEDGVYPGYWHDEPLWSGGPSVTEVYHYWHKGFKHCSWVRLSWDKIKIETRTNKREG